MPGTHVINVADAIRSFVRTLDRTNFGLHLSFSGAVSDLESQNLAAKIGGGRFLWVYEPTGYNPSFKIGLFRVMLQFEIPTIQPYGTVVGVGFPDIATPPRKFEL